MSDNKDKLNVRDIATIGISVSIIFVIGMVFVVGLTSIFSIPSAMVVFATPLLTMVFTVASLKTKKIGTVTLICLVFGLIMIRITPVGVLAILIAALLADLITKLIFKNYDLNKNIIRSAPLMCSLGVWTAWFVMGIFTVEETIYSQGGLGISFVVSVLVYIVGYLVAKLTERIFAKRVAWARDRT